MGPRILVAEDDAQQGAVIQAALTLRGYTVDLVTNGFEAVRRLRSGKYQVALLDYHLPDVDGLSAARLLGDLLRVEDRPRLIALTATPEDLRERQAMLGDASFNTLLSKAEGLPALMGAIELNVSAVAERDAAMMEQVHQLSLQSARVLHRRRLRGVLAATPALIMAAGFTVAIIWASGSVQLAAATKGLADQSALVGASTVALVNAVQDAELSQRSFLLTGSQSSHTTFDADAQRVDQMLVSRTSLTSDASPGFDVDGPQKIIEDRLRTLAEEAGRRPLMPGLPSPGGLSADATAQTLTSLREWAASVAVGSQRALRTGLDAIANNLDNVLAILVIGVAYALADGLGRIRRQWCQSKPLELDLDQGATNIVRMASPANPPPRPGAYALDC